MQGSSSEQGQRSIFVTCVGLLHDRYSAALALHGATLAPYYLDEESNWGLSIPHLREQVKKVRSHGSSLARVQRPMLHHQLSRLFGALWPNHVAGTPGQSVKPQLQAKADGKEVLALVVINPGNPTGGVLSKGNQVPCFGGRSTSTRKLTT